jgi:hypothetical protein
MSGYIKKLSDNGNLREEYFINNGKIEGILKVYDINNKLLVEINYIDDKKNGVCKIYPYLFTKYKEIYYYDDKIISYKIEDNDIEYDLSSLKINTEITRYYYKNREGYYIFKNI